MRQTLYIVLTLLGAIQAYAEVTKIASLEVATDIKIPGPWGSTWDHTASAANWEAGEMYVSSYTGITVIDTNAWIVKKFIPLNVQPYWMCVGPAGLLGLATGFNPSAVAVVDPTTGSTRIIQLPTLGMARTCSFSPEAEGSVLLVSGDGGLASIDTTNWNVTGVWPVKSAEILGVSRRKAYALGLTEILVIDLSQGSAEQVKTIDLGGKYSIPYILTRPKLRRGPHGIYIGVQTMEAPYSVTRVIDPVSDKIVETVQQSGFLVFPDFSDSTYAYFPGLTTWTAADLLRGPGLTLNIFSTMENNIKTTFYRTTQNQYPTLMDEHTSIYWLESRSEATGDDTYDIVATLLDWRLDIYKVRRLSRIADVTNGPMGEHRPYPYPVVPGSYYKIYGEQLTDFTESADLTAGPPPRTLSGINVFVLGGGCIPGNAALLRASPTEIGFQVPWCMELGGAQLFIMDASQQGDRTSKMGVALTVVDTLPEVLDDGTGHPIIIREDGTVVWREAPAIAGGAITIYATGLGAVESPPATPAPAPTPPTPPSPTPPEPNPPTTPSPSPPAAPNQACPYAGVITSQPLPAQIPSQGGIYSVSVDGTVGDSSTLCTVSPSITWEGTQRDWLSISPLEFQSTARYDTGGLGTILSWWKVKVSVSSSLSVPRSATIHFAPAAFQPDGRMFQISPLLRLQQSASVMAPTEKPNRMAFSSNKVGRDGEQANFVSGWVDTVGSVVLPVAVTLDGQQIPVLSAKLSPDLIGIYEINATVPRELQPGTHSLVISVGKASSHPVAVTTQ